ncbi:hypothetical protein BH10ACI1_BH10ACI1_30190 [soil metagenome]
MSNEAAGLGRKRPQLNIPIEFLELDSENPRLAKEGKGNTQFDLLKILYEEFDVEELAYSMAENGYFDEEPLIVVPQNLSADFDFSKNVEEQQKELQQLVNNNKLKFTVVEGNRRTATLKILTDVTLRSKLKVASDFPKPASRDVEEDLKIIPAIVYQRREDISPYLGIRHIAGLLKWEAYAKAVFLAHSIEKGVENGKSIEISIKNVQRQTADRSDVIKKQYLCYKVLKEAEGELNFDVSNIKDRFSLVTVALNSPSIREFIGIESPKKADFSKRIVPTKKLEKLEKLLTWIYGNGKAKLPILTDSRKITNRLAPILADESATEYLLKYENLEEAYERSGGEKKFLMKKLNDAVRNLENALSIAYKYKEDDIREIAEKCSKAVEELQKTLKNDSTS